MGISAFFFITLHHQGKRFGKVVCGMLHNSTDMCVSGDLSCYNLERLGQLGEKFGKVESWSISYCTYTRDNEHFTYMSRV